MKKFFLILLIGTLSIASLAQLPAWVPRNGLIAWYPFTGNTNDSGGKNLNPTYSGAGVTSTTDRYGKPNRAYSFDGATGSYIRIPADSFPSNDRTVSLWFNVPMVSNRPVLMGYGGEGTLGYGTSYLMGLNIEGLGTYESQAHYRSNKIDYAYATEPVNQWVHWVLTISGSTMTIYINGQNVASNNDFVYSTYTTGRDLVFGVMPYADGIAPYTDVNGGYTQGKLDDIGIWKRALTACEIQYLYNSSPDSAIHITQQPANKSVGAGNSAQFKVTSTDTCLTYQWQQDSGNGFKALKDTLMYTGTKTNTLTVNPVKAAMNHYKYRCVIASCKYCKPDTSTSATLTIASGINNSFSATQICVYPNPFGDAIHIAMKDEGPCEFILYDITSRVVMHERFTTSATLHTSMLCPGTYFYEVKHAKGIISNGKLIRSGNE